MRNPMGKSQPLDQTHATFVACSFVYKVAKTYQMPKGEADNPHARWAVWAKSDFNGGQFTGPRDTYISDVVGSMTLTEASDEFRGAYRDHPVIGEMISDLERAERTSAAAISALAKEDRVAATFEKILAEG